MSELIKVNRKSKLIKDQTKLISVSKKRHLRVHQFQSMQLAHEKVTLPGIGKEQGKETTDNEDLIFLNKSLALTNRRLRRKVDSIFMSIKDIQLITRSE